MTPTASAKEALDDAGDNTATHAQLFEQRCLSEHRMQICFSVNKHLLGCAFLTFPFAEISNSQNDVREDLLKVDNRWRGSSFTYSTQKSLSDTDINKSSTVGGTHQSLNSSRVCSGSAASAASESVFAEHIFGPESLSGKSQIKRGTDSGPLAAPAGDDRE